MVDNFPAVFDFNQLFLKLNRSSVTNCQFSAIIGVTAKGDFTHVYMWTRELIASYRWTRGVWEITGRTL